MTFSCRPPAGARIGKLHPKAYYIKDAGRGKAQKAFSNPAAGNVRQDRRLETGDAPVCLSRRKSI
jgi:hypothetical protein